MVVSAAGDALREPLAAVVARVDGGWRPLIRGWSDSAEGRSTIEFVDARVAAGKVVYPAHVLRALELTPLKHVRVVILGQDPYHGPGQAHGLAFSVPHGVRMPPSLRNILAELKRDLGVARSTTDLSSWARQGVLLLNTSLTVESGLPGSHARCGWNALTQSLLQAVSARPSPCAYLLWGAHAQQFQSFLPDNCSEVGSGLVLTANHPSPLSARRPPVPFLGCGHFGLVDRYLMACGQEPIDWSA